MNNTGIPTSERQIESRLDRDLAVTLENMHVGGNVEGSIVVGNENVIGDDNIVLNIHAKHGAVVNIIKGSQEIRPHGMPGQPLRPPRGFTGRKSYLSQLDTLIHSDERVVVYGKDGIGKTALLARASNGNAVLSKPDGVVYVEGIDEQGQMLGKGDIIQRLFDALFLSNPPLKVTFSSARPHTSNRQPVVILDHVRLPIEQMANISELFPKAPVLVTSEEPPGDDAFFPISLPPLERGESIQLLANKSGIALDDTTRPLVDQICDLLGDIPLAISRTANAMRQNGLDIKTVAEQLSAVRPPSQDKIQAAIERSMALIYPALSQQEREMLVMTAAAPGKSVDRAWLEEHAGGEAASRALETLEVLVANSPRLRLSDGIKKALRLHEEDLRHYRGAMLQHLRGELETRSLDFKFTSDELGNILGLLHWASNEGRWSDVIALGRAVDPYLTLHGLWDAWESVLKQVLAAAQNLKDLNTRAWALHQLGTREIGVGTRKRAIGFLWRALTIRLAQADLNGAAYTWHNLKLLLPVSDNGKSTGRERFDWRRLGRNLLNNLWIIGAGLTGLALIILAALPPSIKMTIQARPAAYSQSDQVVELFLTIDRAGFRQLPGPVSVGDSGDELEVITCTELDTTGDEDLVFDWNETIYCIGSYTITEEDVNNGQATRIITAEAGNTLTTSSITIPYVPMAIDLSIQANPVAFDRPDQTITLTYTVRNIGNERVSGEITVEGEKLNGNCPQTEQGTEVLLESGDSVHCTATFATTTENVEAGFWEDTAIARVGNVRSEPARLTIYRATGPMPDPQLSLVKSADPDTYHRVGQVIEYTYTVRNLSRVPLRGPVIIEDETLQDTCTQFDQLQDGILGSLETITCTMEYAITEDDMERGYVTNTAWAAVGDKISEPAVITIDRGIRTPDLRPRLYKSARPASYRATGEQITYYYRLVNEGVIPLRGPVILKDDLANPVCESLEEVGDRDDVLDPRESLLCQATYEIDAADVRNGLVTNTAQAEVGGVASNRATATVYAELLQLDQEADHDTFEAAGEVIQYSYRVVSLSRIPLPGPVTIEDDKIDVSCPDINRVGDGDDFLDWQEEILCEGSYTITQDDLDMQPISMLTNTAIASAGNVRSNSDSVTVNAKQNPKLTLEAISTPREYDSVGQAITYEYVITNAGNVTLFPPFEISSDHFRDGSPFICETDQPRLAPGEAIRCANRETYLVTQADLNFENSSIIMIATGTGWFDRQQVISEPVETQVRCPYPGQDWVLYRVEPGVGLGEILSWYRNINLDLATLQRVNCREPLTEVPERLYVPEEPPDPVISGTLYDMQGNRLNIYAFPVQLMDSNGVVLAETTAQNGQFTLSMSTPGTYFIFGNPVVVRRGANNRDFQITLRTP